MTTRILSLPPLSFTELRAISRDELIKLAMSASSVHAGGPSLYNGTMAQSMINDRVKHFCATEGRVFETSILSKAIDELIIEANTVVEKEFVAVINRLYDCMPVISGSGYS